MTSKDGLIGCVRGKKLQYPLCPCPDGITNSSDCKVMGKNIVFNITKYNLTSFELLDKNS